MSLARAKADVELLCAAYPDEITVEKSMINSVTSSIEFSLTLLDPRHQHGTTTITMELPQGYPAENGLKVKSYRGGKRSLKSSVEKTVAAIRETAHECHVNSEEAGLPCCLRALTVWTELLEEEAQAEETEQREMETNRKTREALQKEEDGEGIEWVSGDVLTDRKSTFQAHVTVVRNDDAVRRALRKLKRNSKIQRATHNMYAYRFTAIGANGQQILKHDNDDDGEDAAGSRLAQLLALREEDGVLVVVSRWYGGILLGPKRFAHIVNVARDLLDHCYTCGLIKKSDKALTSL